MGHIGLTVHPFNGDELFQALSNPHFSPTEVAAHDRAKYLYNYLKTLKTRCILIEDPYTDADYLDDFASYYVRCHTDYERRCRRLHFFSCELPEDWWTRALSPNGLAALQSAYLGFVVARPLPDSIIGRTVLRTYDGDHGRRAYPATLKYAVHLCGLTLSVEETLAFQEQDTILAACATVALWSCFQKTAQLFHTAVLSPSAITKVATRFTHHGRPIPSHGLIVTEMCTAIREVGLEPELFEISGGLPLASLLYAYLRLGLPVVLGVKTCRPGGHAIALAGYSLRDSWVRSSEIGTQVPMRGLRIDALYGHDDQVGPFSRLEIATPGGASDTLLSQAPIYVDERTGTASPLTPNVVIVPVYHKVRITFLDVQKWLTGLHRLFVVWLPDVQLEWDVRLCSVNQYKQDLQTDDWVPAFYRDRALRQDLPRFLWRATLHSNGHVGVDILFDATGLARTVPILSVAWLSDPLSAKIRDLLHSESFAEVAEAILTPQLYRSLSDSFA